MDGTPEFNEGGTAARRDMKDRGIVRKIAAYVGVRLRRKRRGTPREQQGLALAEYVMACDRRTWCRWAVVAAGGGGALFVGGTQRKARAAEPPSAGDTLPASEAPTANNALTAERRAASAAAGREFLAGLWDAELRLLPEFPGAKTYWLYHDNYLAAKVLEESHPDIARAIRAALADFGVQESGKIEILFDEARRPWPLRHHRLDDVAERDGRRIRTERVTERPMRDWQAYADLLCFAAIARRHQDAHEADGYLAAALDGWDGVGLADRVSRQHGMYATYKLALVCLAAVRLDRTADVPAAVWQRLLAMQRSDRGFVTDYNRQGEPVGEANVETTSLAVLALAGWDAMQEARPDAGRE